MMTNEELFEFLKAKLRRVVDDYQLAEEEISASAEGRLMTAVFRGQKGQAETAYGSEFTGRVKDILALDLSDAKSRSLFVSSLNAMMGALGLATRTTHCKGREAEFCAENITNQIHGSYGNPTLALVGAEKPMADALSRNFTLKAASSTEIEDPVTKEAIDWAELVVCTGSVICDGTLCEYLNLEKEVLFFGNSISGAAEWLGIQRLCL